ncbi:hypothetical protein AC578_6136 [Pseudocercospora eumusae]|uniref:Uncharacterized protein n=1 Tax=Pseudocercospora eumusae TaxID=321146 RepID=A0A139GXR6_9PEZI|nr:hypothetical protein AC578_6136 [Pseudocercospora eumusae]
MIDHRSSFALMIEMRMVLHVSCLDVVVSEGMFVDSQSELPRNEALGGRSFAMSSFVILAAGACGGAPERRVLGWKKSRSNKEPVLWQYASYNAVEPFSAA